MRRIHFAFVVPLALAGCLHAVDLPGQPDGSAPQPGQDASPRPGADASQVKVDASYSGPDAGASCSLDTDCPSGSVCGYEATNCSKHCVAGCHDGTQCGAGESCAMPRCNDLCACSVGRCVQNPGCGSDLECVSGKICVQAGCNPPKTCETGCRDSSLCGAGQYCQILETKCGDSIGTCVAAPACTADKDCPLGEVCDFVLGQIVKACVFGCHDQSQCAATEQCVIDHCYDCPNCPCYGECRAKAQCKSDADCSQGTVCGSEAALCNYHCVPGCHLDGQCRADQQCTPPMCAGACGCDVGKCDPKPVECSDDSGCGAGSVCGYEDPYQCSGKRTCVSGCFKDQDCGQGMVCNLADCGPCCAGSCGPKPPCKLDSECGTGQICWACPGGDSRCEPGCRDASGCGPDQICQPFYCQSDCGCASQCLAKPATCTADSECGVGMICEPCGAGGANTCVMGCRTVDNCQPGDSCQQVDCTGGGTGPWCCPNRCAPTPVSCKQDWECGVGMICDAACGSNGQAACVRGCRDANGCQANEVCGMVVCAGMCCPAQCEPAPGACKEDWECGLGMICEDGCGTGTKTCINGCRTAAGCQPNQICVQMICDMCPCPSMCEPAPAPCSNDYECGLGEVCEVGNNCTDPKSCVLGCHLSSQCEAGQVCVPQADCLTCPCPGTCETPACLLGQLACGSTLDCQWESTFCTGSCCSQCPAVAQPTCGPTEARYPSGLDGNGCPLADHCGPAGCACPADEIQVCSVDGTTWAGQCEADCAGAQVLHLGACLPYEGMQCGWSLGGNSPTCPAGQWCRDTCPMCDAGDSTELPRCATVGACIWAFECPDGLPQPACPNGPAKWDCVNHACVSSCP